MASIYLTSSSLFLAFVLLRLIIRRLRLHSIAYLPGPAPGSWLVGNLPALVRPENIGDAEFAWVKAFDTSVRIKGAFGRDVLLTADPKSLQYMTNTAAYSFPKSPEARVVIRVLTGNGMSWAEGAQHSRQRKVLSPAFGYEPLRVFLPLFRVTAQKTVSKWKDLVVRSESTSVVINITEWLNRMTLDALGAAAFDYDFNATDEGAENELAKVYNNLFADLFLNGSDYAIAFEALCGIIPQWMVSTIQSIPNKQNIRMQNYMKAARRVAKSLVDRQMELHAAGNEGGKDIMSILVRANLSEDPKTKLDEDELLSQMTTIMLAGHEGAASTVAWALYELSKNPEVQNKIREEIKCARDHAAERGADDLSIADLDSMKYLLAVMKETFRYHPIVPSLTRVAGRDDVIPLSAPLRTKSGKVITGIPVSKGQTIILSLAAYNRLTSVWGEDAHVWRPERFLEGLESTQKTRLGVFANVATFGSGLRGCIGWRFALIEMQAMLVELLENFQFSPPPGNVEIIRAAASLMTPMVKGSDTGRTTLPLTITPVW